MMKNIAGFNLHADSWLLWGGGGVLIFHFILSKIVVMYKRLWVNPSQPDLVQFQSASTGQNCKRSIFTNENMVQHRTSGCKWTWPITGNNKEDTVKDGSLGPNTAHTLRTVRAFVLVYVKMKRRRVMLLSPGRDAWSNLPLAYLHSDMKTNCQAGLRMLSNVYKNWTNTIERKSVSL